METIEVRGSSLASALNSEFDSREVSLGRQSQVDGTM